MTSPNSHDAISIPERDRSVNSTAQELLEQFPLQVDTYGLTFDMGCSQEVKLNVCECLIAVDREQTLRNRFRMGDAYNSIEGYGNKRKLIETRFGFQYYNLFRVCGFVAKKWPLRMRNNNHTWDWYRRNDPGTPPQGRNYATYRLTELGREQTDEGEIIHYEAPDGRTYTALAKQPDRLTEDRIAYSER